MPFVPLVADEKRDWKAHTVVVPAISTGNVGQLAVDALVCTLPAVKIGYFPDEHVLPYASNDAIALASGQGELSLGVEVYECVSRKLVIIQQRAPVVKGRTADFAKNLFDWIQASGFKSVVLLSSTHAHARSDKQLAGPQFQYFSAGAATPLRKVAESMTLPWMGDMTETEAASLKRSLPKKSPLLDDEEIDEFDNAPRKAGIERKGDGAGKATDSKAAGAAAKGDSKSGDSKQSSEKRVPRVKGGGITHAAFRLAATRGLDLLGLVMFSNEGDNSGDGVLMAALVDAVTNTAQGGSGPAVKEWRVPDCWSRVFGSPADESLYT